VSAGDVARPVVVYGAGGHGRVVAEALERAALGAVQGYLDDDPTRAGMLVGGRPVLGGRGALPPGAPVALGIGGNAARRSLAERLLAEGAALASVVHPSAVISSRAVVEAGAFVGPLAVVNVDARVGAGAIVNSGAIVEHDCVIGAWAHVAPRVALGGGSRVGEGALLGTGAVVLPGVSVGAWSVVGAGAVVIRDLPAGVVAVGVPARIIRRTSP